MFTADSLTLNSGEFRCASDADLQRHIAGRSGSVGVGRDATFLAVSGISQAATGMIRADSLEAVNSGTSGDVNLPGQNDVSVLAISNLAEHCKIAFFDVNELVIGAVGSTSGLDTNAGNISITAVGDLRVSESINAAHNSLTNGFSEQITLISRSGNFILDNGLVISSDEDPAPGAPNPDTDDRITIVAGSDGGAGVVDLGSDIQIRTDGGVARQIAPRPQVFVPAETAFFEAESPANMRSGLLYVNGEFLGIMDLVFGVAGEENLQVVIDWGSVSQSALNGIPASNVVPSVMHPGALEFTLSDAEKSRFIISEGGERYFIPHFYSVTDLVKGPFENGRAVNLSIFGVRFSVAQHESINIWGTSAADPSGSGTLTTPAKFQFDGTPSTLMDAAMMSVNLATPGLALLTSTDTNPLNAIPQQGSPMPFELSEPTFSGTPVRDAEWEFVSGPPPGLVLVEPPPRPVADVKPLSPPPEPGLVAEPIVAVDFGKAAINDAALGTQVFLQIRRQFEVDADSEIILDKLPDRSILSSREAFEHFVSEHPELQDGSGYEVWLSTDTSGQAIRQPILKFDITGGRPEPATEQLPPTFEPPQLRELNFDQPDVDAQPNSDTQNGSGTQAGSGTQSGGDDASAADRQDATIEAQPSDESGPMSAVPDPVSDDRLTDDRPTDDRPTDD
ncbi:MAG: hypothetical protein R3C19_09890 [Planctomycetaceae bacterium]